MTGVVDHYEVLGLRRDASGLAIKRAYRRLAKKHHPDRNPSDPSAEDRFKEIAAAYAVLGDAEKRREYDRELLLPRREARDSGPSSDPGGAPPAPAVFRDGSQRFRIADGVLGALLAFSFAMAAVSRPEARSVTEVTLGALVTGCLLAEGAKSRVTTGARSRARFEALLLVSAGLGALASVRVAPGAARAVVDSGGWLCAVAGGMAGGLLGARFGRIFRSAAGSLAGGLSSVLIGAALGAGFGGFLWYWTTVFRWLGRPWPPDENLSLLAFAGVIGGALGGGLAGLVGTSRTLGKERP